MTTMSREEWERLEEVLDAALELPADERVPFIERACGTQELLRNRARAVLVWAERAGDFLERPADAFAAGLLQEIAVEVELGLASGGNGSVAGDRLGPYRLVRELGRGGMGAVYLAERDDEQYDRRVAIKVLPAGPLSRGLRTRFLLERRILASLEHPNIARLYDAGVADDGTPYFVMEYVEGRPIAAHCDEGRLPIKARLGLFDQVCDAVQFAHRTLVVHRDLKPANILVSNDGVVKLLDFGIAKLVSEEQRDGGAAETDPATRTGFRILTPEYASPEQLRGEPVSTATDIYALGVLLFELLAGRWPYRPRDRTALALERAVLEQDPDSASGAITEPDSLVSERRATTPAGLRRQLRGDLDNIVLTALRKEPERRYPSVQHLRDDIRRYLERRPVSARPATWGYRTTRFVRRHRVGVAAAAIVAASLVAGLAGTVWQAQAASRQARRAEGVRQFVVELFQVSDPNRSRGDTITARALLDRGVERLNTDLASEPELRAEMLAVLGGIYRKLGLYDRARPLLEEALAVRGARLGRQNLEVAQSAADLASLLYEQGEYQRAEEVTRRGLAVRRDLLGPEDTLVAASMTDLAAILSSQGKQEEAESLYRAGLELDRKRGAQALVATDLDNLSVTLWRRGKYAEAIPLAEEALVLRRRLHGEEHTEVATSLLNLASILKASGEYDRAEDLVRACLAMRRKLLGDGHPHVALALNNLGLLLHARGRLEEAEQIHRDALAIRRAAFGDDHLEVAASLNNVGTLLYAKGDLAGAANHFEQALTIWRRELAGTHPNLLSGLNNLGAARRDQGDLEGAEPVLREALALRRKALGDEHPDVAQSLNNLGELLAKKGEYAEAEVSFRTALASWRAALGAGNPTVAGGLLGLGRMMLTQGRWAEAEPLLREALAIRLAKLDPESADLAVARLFLGSCLVKLQRFGEAEPLLLASYPVLQKQRGEEHDITRRARSALAELYRAWGRPKEALGYSR